MDEYPGENVSKKRTTGSLLTASGAYPKTAHTLNRRHTNFQKVQVAFLSISNIKIYDYPQRACISKRAFQYWYRTGGICRCKRQWLDPSRQHRQTSPPARLEEWGDWPPSDHTEMSVPYPSLIVWKLWTITIFETLAAQVFGGLYGK